MPTVLSARSGEGCAESGVEELRFPVMGSRGHVVVVGGGLITLAQSLIGEIAPPRQRFRFQVYITSTFTSASFCGPVLGGWLVSHAHWRWLFILYLPMSAFAFWRLAKLAPGARHPEQLKTLDMGGIALFAIAASTGLYWLTSGGRHFPWVSAISA